MTVVVAMNADDLRALESATVLSADAQPVGEIAAVHVNAASDLLFVEVEDQSGRNLVIPAERVRLRDALIVPFGAARVQQGPTLPEGADLSPDLARAVLSYYDSAAPEVEPEEAPVVPSTPDPAKPAEMPGEAPGTGGGTPFKRENWPPLVKVVDPAVVRLVTPLFGGSPELTVAPPEEAGG